ncbi:hypothetical protein F8S13_11350 [Chloroflexia bacterium SDU3-3]|nr:hypothetical protein F8S13_11350 [Chloroflexia bacterium SDU3-3]
MATALAPAARPAPSAAALARRIRALIAVMIAGLVISGLTALPLRWEIDILAGLIGPGSAAAQLWPDMAAWVGIIRQTLAEVERSYPLMLYGTDWLAFAHIVIAIAFVGPLRDPVRNIWVIEFGMIACVLIFPMALAFGPLRGVPLFWQMIDCSFGVVGFVPLWLAQRDILALEKLQRAEVGA